MRILLFSLADSLCDSRVGGDYLGWLVEKHTSDEPLEELTKVTSHRILKGQE